MASMQAPTTFLLVVLIFIKIWPTKSSIHRNYRMRIYTVYIFLNTEKRENNRTEASGPSEVKLAYREAYL